MSIVQRLMQDSASLGVQLSESAAGRLLRLLQELARWNHTYNLTAIRGSERMLTHHLLDSLSIQCDLRGTQVADVGTGAGFPGLPLAVADPDRQFTLIDSNGKKIRFVRHAVRELGLTNVDALHARVETLEVGQPYDTIVSRALAPLPQMLGQVARLCGPATQVLAMKGKWPTAEIEALPAGWYESGSRQVLVPGLDEARCVIGLRSAAPLR
ncbi:MAG TPA: 16S rRNA (guanine(527)-N(7))-methyltransferase RsmG [Steroidobacteraceae bacterium]